MEPSGLDDTHIPHTSHTLKTCPFSSNEGLHRSLTCDYSHFSNSDTLKKSFYMFIQKKPTKVSDLKNTLKY